MKRLLSFLLAVSLITINFSYKSSAFFGNKISERNKFLCNEIDALHKDLGICQDRNNVFIDFLKSINALKSSDFFEVNYKDNSSFTKICKQGDYGKEQEDFDNLLKYKWGGMQNLKNCKSNYEKIKELKNRLHEENYYSKVDVLSLDRDLIRRVAELEEQD